jgi:hypothetical protein
MIIAPKKFGDRIRLTAIKYEGRFRKRRRPSLLCVSEALFYWRTVTGFALNLCLRYFIYVMPATLNRPTNIADRLGEARRVQSQIDKLERKLITLLNGLPKNLLVRNRYGLTAAEMTKIARNLHARAKERIARARSKDFRGSIETLL